MKTATFLLKGDSGREAVMRLPIGKHGSISAKAFAMARARLGDSARYFLNLEAFSGADALMEALTKYKKDTV